MTPVYVPVNAGAGVAIAHAQAVAAERRLMDAFRLADATAPDRARSPEEMNVVPDAAFGRLLAAGVLRERPRGTFYLDEAAVIARRDATPKRGPLNAVLLVTILALTVGLIGLLVMQRA